MARLLWLSMKIRFSVTANRLIYFLRSIPGLKRAISPGAYGSDSLKTAFIILSSFFIASKKIMIHLLHLAFLLALGLGLNQIDVHGGLFALLEADATMPEGAATGGVVGYALFVWFIMGVVGGITSSVVASENHKNDDVIVNHLRIDAAVYSHARILFARVVDILLFIPTLLIAFNFAGIPLWGVITTLAMYTALRLLGEAVNLLMYSSIEKHFGTHPFSILVFIIFVAAAVVVPANMGMPDLAAIFANPIAAALFVPIGIVSWIYIKRYPMYLPLLKGKIRWYNDATAEVQKIDSTLNFKDAQKWNKNITSEDLILDKHANKTGFAYLNAIFFDRHKKYFKKRLLARCIIFLALPVAAAIFCVYSLINGVSPADLFENTKIRSLFNFAPMFFFVIYLATMGKVVTASVFTNCDIHMLHYPYYRVKETILASFKARFAVILRYNFIITTVMSLSVLVAVALIFGSMDYMYAGMFFILLLFIGLLFSFNDLFLYYVIQPYDTAGKSKSAVYTVINFVIYTIAFLNINNFRFDLFTYSAVVITATVLYAGIGLALLVSFAPKNFRLR